MDSYRYSVHVKREDDSRAAVWNLKAHTVEEALSQCLNKTETTGFENGEEADNPQIASGEKIESKRLYNSKELIIETVKSIKDTYRLRGEFPGIESGFMDIDFYTQGFLGSKLYSVVGRPSVGKSTLIYNIISNIAVKSNTPVLLLTNEDKPTFIMCRILSSINSIPLRSVQCGMLTKKNFLSLSESAGRLYDSPMYIEPVFNSTIENVCKRIRYNVKNYGVKIIFFDSINRIPIIDKLYQMKENMNYTVNTLKDLSLELDIPIVITAQQNRNVYKGKKMTAMENFFYRGESLAQTADSIFILHSENNPNNSRESVPAYIEIIKPTDDVIKLHFFHSYGRFEGV